MNRTEIEEILKQEMIERLDLDMEKEEIKGDNPLFGYDQDGNGLGLDSIDVLEIVVILRQNFGLEIKAEENREIFKTLNALVGYVESEINKEG